MTVFCHVESCRCFTGAYYLNRDIRPEDGDSKQPWNMSISTRLRDATCQKTFMLIRRIENLKSLQVTKVYGTRHSWPCKRIFTVESFQPHAQPPTWRTILVTSGDRVTQLYPQALGTHSSRLLRHAWVTLRLFLSSGHHTETCRLLSKQKKHQVIRKSSHEPPEYMTRDLHHHLARFKVGALTSFKKSLLPLYVPHGPWSLFTAAKIKLIIR
jgi:hypothetical protein